MRNRSKVLHVVRCMDRGGIETWLMNVLRNADHSRFEFHILVNRHAAGCYEQELEQLGAIIHRGPDAHHLASFISYLSRTMRESGPFDAVHSHLYWYSGVILKIASEAGVPVRIAHSHTSRLASGFNIARRLYESTMQRAVARYATHRLAVSKQAGEALFGTGSRTTFRILYYGLDFTRFGRLGPGNEMKRHLGIPENRIVLGHVGRFLPVKNHRFLLDVFRSVLRQQNAHLLLVGNGPLLPEIESRVAVEGMSSRCTFAGLREDVAPWIGAMDILLLPSLWEGLPLVTLEAQAAGVPVLASEAVSREIDVLPGMVDHLALDAGADLWAAASLRLAPNRRSPARSAALMSQSRFSLEKCISALDEIYSKPSPTMPHGATV